MWSWKSKTKDNAALEVKPDGPARLRAPDALETCAHCGRRCRVPVTRYMPEKVQQAYEQAGWAFMATCEGGAKEESGLLGASYEDVILDRLGRAENVTEAERLRSVSQDLRAVAEETREKGPAGALPERPARREDAGRP